MAPHPENPDFRSLVASQITNAAVNAITAGLRYNFKRSVACYPETTRGKFTGNLTGNVIAADRSSEGHNIIVGVYAEGMDMTKAARSGSDQRDTQRPTKGSCKRRSLLIAHNSRHLA